MNVVLNKKFTQGEPCEPGAHRVTAVPERQEPLRVLRGLQGAHTRAAPQRHRAAEAALQLPAHLHQAELPGQAAAAAIRERYLQYLKAIKFN